MLRNGPTQGKHTVANKANLIYCVHRQDVHIILIFSTVFCWFGHRLQSLSVMVSTVKSNPKDGPVRSQLLAGETPEANHNLIYMLACRLAPETLG